MTFWGGIARPSRTCPFVPPPDGYSLHLSQASLPPSTKEGTRVALLARIEEEQEVILATLCAGRQDSVSLDLFFAE